MLRALVIVDYQNDFLPTGALGVPDGHRTWPEIDRQANDLKTDLIVLTRDWHPADHISFSNDPKYEDKSWPSHCVQNTEGAEFDEILLDRLPTDKLMYIVSKGEDKNVEEYSGFSGRAPDGALLVEILEEHDVWELVIVGLALDYCVKATALDAIKEGFDVILPVEGTRPVTYETGARAIAELAYAGVVIA